MTATVIEDVSGGFVASTFMHKELRADAG